MKNIYRTFNVLSSKEKKKLLIFFFIILITASLEVVGISLIFPLLNSIMNVELLDKFNLFFFKYFNINLNVYLLLLIISFIFLLKNLILIFFNWYNLSFSGLLKSRVISNTLKVYLNRNYAFFLDNSNAEILRNIQNAEKFQTYILNLISIASDLVLLISLLIFSIFIEPKIIIPVIFISIISIFINFFFRKFLVTKGKEKHRLVIEMHKWLLESLGAIKDIKILNKEYFFYRNFKTELKKINYIERTARVINHTPRYLIEIFIVINFALTFGFFYSSLLNNKEFITTISFLLMTILRITGPIGRMIPSFQVITYFKNEINIFLDDYEVINKIEPSKENLYKSKNNSYLSNTKNKNLIIFDDVTFSYKNNSSPIFMNVDFIADENKIIGISGVSGVGKSTFLDLILGLLIPNKGNIYSNGKNIHEDIVSWKNKIGYVSQNPYLLNETILKNVAFGNYDYDIDLEKAISSLRKSLLLTTYNDKEINDFIYRTIGESSRKLSGGQKQRLAIARAFYRNPKIIILDEATNALDYDNENKFFNSLKENKKDKLIIIVSHKSSDLKFCDTLYKVEDSKLKLILN